MANGNGITLSLKDLIAIGGVIAAIATGVAQVYALKERMDRLEAEMGKLETAKPLVSGERFAVAEKDLHDLEAEVASLRSRLDGIEAASRSNLKPAKR